jgi:hypothetical protein
MNQQTIYTPDEARELILSGEAPENMIITGHFIMCGCHDLAYLPKGMTVIGYAYIGECHGLTSLPEGMTVSAGLAIEQCASLACLAECMTVRGNCSLRSCPSLTSIPEEFNLDGHLFIERCPNLRSIPSSWKVPNLGNIDAMILEALEAVGELNMSEWHTCETTHSRLGWAVHLAGEDGKRLEDRFGTAGAGALLYIASGKPAPDFYASDEDTMASIREGARS